MQNINEKIDNLIREYDVDKHHPGFRRKEAAVHMINEFVRDYLTDGDVMIAGSSLPDIEFFLNDADIQIPYEKGVWNANGKNEHLKFNSNKVVIVSNYWRREIFTELLVLYDGLEIITLYDYFELHGLYCDGNYYDVFRQGYRNYHKSQQTLDYSDIDFNRIIVYDTKMYEQSSDQSLRRLYLEKMIFDFIYIRDFVNLEKYIEKYGEFEGTGYRQYACFMKQIKSLIAQVKDELTARKRKDLVMFWLDQLEYGSDGNMKFLNSLNGKGLNFEQAYTVTPYTGPTAKALFCKAYPVDDKSYKIKKINLETSPVLRFLDREGYEFSCYSGEFETYFNRDGEVQKHLHGPFNLYTPVTLLVWEAFCTLLNSENPQFVLIHEFTHTHTPCISPVLNEKSYSSDQLLLNYDKEEANLQNGVQRRVSREYLDGQLEYFSEFLPAEAYKIYMSDHGYTSFGRYHAIFKVVQQELKAESIREMFSYIDFYELLQFLFKGENNSGKTFLRPFVKVQDVDYYYGAYIQLQWKERRLERYRFGYQGVITDSDMYLRYNDGQEILLKSENDGKFITEERADYLKSMTGKKMIDVEHDDKFQYAKYVYRVFDRYKKRNSGMEDRRVQAVKQLFAGIGADETVAIRGGGYHSVRLLMLLGSELRKKVRYLIDQNSECIAGRLGIEVISPECMPDYQIDWIVISSFAFGKKWMSQLKEHGAVGNIIELYDFLEQKGMACSQAFYYPHLEEDDYHVNFPEEQVIDEKG